MIRRLRKARGEYETSNVALTKKAATIKRFLNNNETPRTPVRSSKTDSFMKSERLDVVLNEQGEATGLVGYAAFEDMKSLMAEADVWNGGFSADGKITLIRVEIGWAYWGARHRSTPHHNQPPPHNPHPLSDNPPIEDMLDTTSPPHLELLLSSPIPST